MSGAGAAFVALVDAGGSLLFGLGLAAAAGRVVRAGDSRAGLALAATPWAKVAYDAARGAPSLAWSATGAPAAGAPWGAEGAVGGGALGHAEWLRAALVRHVGPAAPACLLAAWAAVAAWRLGARLVAARRFARAAGALRRGARASWRERLGRREVDVFVSAAHRGAPFAGGLWRPYVCFGAAAYDALAPAERRAVLDHELAHLARHDLVALTALAALADVLWFVPGARAPARRAAELCELGADRAAVAAGASPLDLAAAIVRVAELAPADAGGAALTALVRDAPLVARRVRRPADWPAAPPPGPGRVPRALRPCLVALAVAFVVSASATAGHGTPDVAAPGVGFRIGRPPPPAPTPP
jgi:Zn-dependent protease with chaperone function